MQPTMRRNTVYTAKVNASNQRFQHKLYEECGWRPLISQWSGRWLALRQARTGCAASERLLAVESERLLA
eukprot:2574170-Rhodomonas_salina.1